MKKKIDGDAYYLEDFGLHEVSNTAKLHLCMEKASKLQLETENNMGEGGFSGG